MAQKEFSLVAKDFLQVKRVPIVHCTVLIENHSRFVNEWINTLDTAFPFTSAIILLNQLTDSNAFTSHFLATLVFETAKSKRFKDTFINIV